MGFPDQVRKFLGRNVRVDTTNGTFTGRLVRVNSTTIVLRENNHGHECHRNRDRILIRDSKIIAVREIREHEGIC